MLGTIIEEAEEELINGLIEETVRIPRKYARIFPTHLKDIHSVAQSAIVVAYSVYGQAITVNLAAKVVKYEVINYLSGIPCVTIPATTGRRLRAQGKDTMIETVTTTGVTVDGTLVRVEAASLVPAPRTMDEEDTIRCICLTQCERAIVDYRLDGLTYEQIGEKLGLKKSRIGQLIQDIRRRFCDTRSLR